MKMERVSSGAENKERYAVVRDVLAQIIKDEDVFKRSVCGKGGKGMRTTLQNIFAQLDVLYQNGRTEDALAFLYTAEKEIVKEYGENSREHVAILSELGGYYRSYGQYGESEQAYQKALMLQKRQTGEENADFATLLNNLAGTFRLAGRTAEAETLFHKSIEIYRHTIGDGQMLYASAWNNLALLYQDEKRFEEAICCHTHAVEALKKDQAHPVETATSYYNLALCLKALQSQEDAIQMLGMAKELYEQSVNPHHPLYGRCQKVWEMWQKEEKEPS